MDNQDIRQKRRAVKKRQAARGMLFGIALAVVVLAAGAIWYTNAHQGPMGQEFDVMAANHVAEGSDPGPYNSNPPTSGRHYASEYDAGFYRPGDPATLAPYPAGYLVHNLEHGYVIFWYNCEALDSSADCTALQDAIAAVMNQADNWKMIAFPWTSIDTPVVLTTWGRLLAMDEFDADLAMDFVRRNRNQAPEPNAP